MSRRKMFVTHDNFFFYLKNFPTKPAWRPSYSEGFFFPLRPLPLILHLRTKEEKKIKCTCVRWDSPLCLCIVKISGVVDVWLICYVADSNSTRTPDSVAESRVPVPPRLSLGTCVLFGLLDHQANEWAYGIFASIYYAVWFITVSGPQKSPNYLILCPFQSARAVRTADYNSSFRFRSGSFERYQVSAVSVFSTNKRQWRACLSRNKFVHRIC